MFLEDVVPGLCQVGRARVDLGAVGLHHYAPVGLLVVADAHLAVVVGLGDCGVRLVAAGWGDALVLVVDVGRGVEEPLEAPGAEEGCRAPEAVDLAHLLRDGDVRLARHLLPYDLLREERRERGGSSPNDRSGTRLYQLSGSAFSSSRNFVVSTSRTSGFLACQPVSTSACQLIAFCATMFAATTGAKRAPQGARMLMADKLLRQQDHRVADRPLAGRVGGAVD